MAKLAAFQNVQIGKLLLKSAMDQGRHGTMDGSTKLIKNRDSKKNGLVIGQSVNSGESTLIDK